MQTNTHHEGHEVGQSGAYTKSFCRQNYFPGICIPSRWKLLESRLMFVSGNQRTLQQTLRFVSRDLT
jgi:hypothetical protein